VGMFDLTNNRKIPDECSLDCFVVHCVLFSQ
jgi:hypothetical protein